MYHRGAGLEGDDLVELLAQCGNIDAEVGQGFRGNAKPGDCPGNVAPRARRRRRLVHGDGAPAHAEKLGGAGQGKAEADPPGAELIGAHDVTARATTEARDQRFKIRLLITPKGAAVRERPGHPGNVEVKSHPPSARQ